MQRKTIACLAVIATVAAGQAVADNVDLDAVRSATGKYQDVNMALADGFIPDPSGHCITAAEEGLPPEWGGMGIHYIHPARLQITGDKPRVNGTGTNTDWMEPAILLYEPQADGSLQLVGVENLVWKAAWDATGKPHPEINGKAWDLMQDDLATAADEAHGFEPHMDQHVWLFRDNPAGVLMPFNPNVSCEHHKGN